MSLMGPSPVVVAASHSDQSHSLHNVFVYGSLLADDVVRVLLKRIPQSSSAVLHGYQRFSVRGRVYPAILPVENKRITGKVLFGITNPEMDILDMFEDVEYEKNVVEVSLVDGSEKLAALTYVWSSSSDADFLYGEWNFEEWKQSHMDDFVQMTTRFVEELQLPEPKSRVATYESFYHKGGAMFLKTLGRQAGPPVEVWIALIQRKSSSGPYLTSLFKCFL
ncbi:AIG2-like protein D isoform X2 [Benincasa hispida]|uniref:AIG2-like protein D isoform X2 n=1 Tax=Benincasa hispida TaxID=102211 RepID=UPI0018FF52EB|nr:AIG2-like protein D isoform X2 [Benincasa hispida]